MSPEGPRASGFPGGTSVTRLAVYSPRCAVDGLAGGTPHLHTASTEAYVVTGGQGILQALDTAGFLQTPLAAGTTLWFTPGTIHRVVNHRDLRIVVIMENAGLPEAGDAVMTFPAPIVGDPERYRSAATLPAGATPEQLDEAVRRRRELAVEGFRILVAAAERGDRRPLEDLYDSATALVRPKTAGWQRIWRDTVERQTRHTGDVLAALAGGDCHHLRSSAVLESPPSPAAGWGMCGRLHTHDVTHPIVHSLGQSRG